MSRRAGGRVAHILLAAILTATAGATSAFATVFNVTNSTTLNTALATVNPGDTILLADGSYAGFTVSRSGASGANIVIKALNQGAAVISSGIVHLSKVSFVSLQGFDVTTSGGSVSTDSTTRHLGFWFDAASNCEVARCTFAMTGAANSTYWIYLGGASSNNHIDYCEFGPNTVGGGTHYIFPAGNPTIPGVTPPADRTPWASGGSPFNPNMARNTHIDHNYFHDEGSGDGEIIVLGGLGETGDYQDTDSVVESNLFVNCNGDAEIISVKSSSNILRYNTVRTSNGVFSLRAGNKDQVYGNFFLCGGIGGGVKMCEMDHLVYNNYIENTDTSNYPIMCENGDPYSSSTFAHAQVLRAHIMYNTCINVGRQFLLGHSSASPLFPDSCVIANNIITGKSGVTLYSDSSPTNCIWSQNVVFPTAVSGMNSSQFFVANPNFNTSVTPQRIPITSPVRNLADTNYYPFVITDMDGQMRGMTTDIGADQYSPAVANIRPLTTSDVGPDAGNPALAFNGNYKIVNANSGLAVVVQNGSTASGAALIQFQYNGTGNDEWRFQKLSDGYWEIINLKSAKCMNVNGASTADGASVIQWPFGGVQTNDEWEIDPANAGNYIFINHNSGRLLEVVGSSTSNNAAIDQRRANGGLNQQFQIIAIP